MLDINLLETIELKRKPK